ncbi:hypothetical protein GW17_00039618 [Ensete ventricosum]|nr:hypothetical protein GW17_00039618 [Ensete ventricosum]
MWPVWRMLLRRGHGRATRVLDLGRVAETGPCALGRPLHNLFGTERSWSFYSGCYRLFVPDDLTVFMTHHAVASLTMSSCLSPCLAYGSSHSSSSSTSSLPHLSTWNLGGRITSSVKKVVEVFTWTGLCRWRRFRSHGLRRARLMGRSWITKS